VTTESSAACAMSASASARLIASTPARNVSMFSATRLLREAEVVERGADRQVGRMSSPPPAGMWNSELMRPICDRARALDDLGLTE